MLPAFSPLNFAAQPDLSRLQDAVEAPLRRLLSVPFIDGILIADIALGSASPALIQHGLGRDWVGWWPVDIFGNGRIYRVTSTPTTGTILPLQATASITASIWVF